jgi:SNF2 family DNA or RNA helicase
MRSKSQLREYQQIIINHALNTPRCAIWAGMGMGKTASTLTAVSALTMVEDDPILVLAPLRVAQSTWPDEAKEWDHLQHLRIAPVIGDERQRRAALGMKADIYTTNYENLEWLQAVYGDHWPFRTVVADEATRLKSFRLKQGGKRAQALGKVAHSHIRRFVQLTGTPAPNGLQDLWGQMWFLDAGKRLGRTYSSFQDRWFQRSMDGFGSTPMEHAQSEIQERLGDICLTVDAKDWFELKEPIVNNLFVDLPPRARVLYKDMEKTMFMQFDGHEIEAFNAAAKTQKLLQLANGAVYLDPTVENDDNLRAKEWKQVHDTKIQVLGEIVEEARGAPVLVAYHFKSDLARLLKAFPKGRHLDKNPQTIKDWNAGRIPVLFAHPQSAGHGLSLQHGGNILVFFSHNWNLEDRLQIIERIGPVRQRQSGYERPVFIHNIIARDTVDEVVIARVQTKREVQDLLLDYMRQRRN